MKKRMRLAAFLTAGVLALAPCVLTGMTVFADEVANSITITPAQAGTHNYAAYQIFKGKLSGTGAVDNPDTTDVDETDPYILSDIDWGDNVDGTTFLSALQAADEFKLKPSATEGDPPTSIFAGAESAEDVAGILEEYNNNSDVALAFAKFAGEHLKAGVDAKGSDDTSPYKIEGTAENPFPAGYYLIKDNMTDKTQARTLNMLKVLGAVEMKTKETLPQLDKKIDEYGGISANTASIGDVVPFVITSSVPDMTGFDKYFFVINDQLSKGLTYNTNSISVAVNKSTLSSDAYTFETETDETTQITTMKIVFKNFIQYKTLNDDNPNNDEIVVRYSATVNDDADLTQTGNENKAQLTYSNDPYAEQTPLDEQHPDEPKSTTPQGLTPWVNTLTYVTQIQLTKIDADTPAALANATFKLEGYKKSVTVNNGQYFIKTEDTDTPTEQNPFYYRLKDGTYKLVTEFNPDEDEYYDSTVTTYKLVTIDPDNDETAIPETSLISMQFTTPNTGIINFKGLGEGVYTITEIEAPSGYNKLAHPIQVTITTDGVTLEECEWECTITDPSAAVVSSETVTFTQGDKAGTDSVLALSVKNKKGNLLPSTGGIGTKLFYLIGGMLIVGSGVVLVAKKRTKDIEK